MEKTDEQLQQDVIDELGAEGNLDASTIAVAVKNGMVELLGVVPSYAEKEVAERAVRRVGGVRGIVDKLRTKDKAKRPR
ncbi:MAG TPA: BON domain-containing protein [Candidatus Binatia bacterium]|nr:BON domain-containing protein [Candidatus Binatia bacterium]